MRFTLIIVFIGVRNNVLMEKPKPSGSRTAIDNIVFIGVRNIILIGKKGSRTGINLGLLCTSQVIMPLGYTAVVDNVHMIVKLQCYVGILGNMEQISSNSL